MFVGHSSEYSTSDVDKYLCQYHVYVMMNKKSLCLDVYES